MDKMQSKIVGVLKQMYRDCGRGMFDHPNRCNGYLRDMCPEAGKNIYILVEALRVGIAKDLDNISKKMPIKASIETQAKKLENARPFVLSDSRWAVACLALALGHISDDEFKKILTPAKKVVPPPKPTAPPPKPVRKIHPDPPPPPQRRTPPPPPPPTQTYTPSPPPRRRTPKITTSPHPSPQLDKKGKWPRRVVFWLLAFVVLPVIVLMASGQIGVEAVQEAVTDFFGQFKPTPTPTVTNIPIVSPPVEVSKRPDRKEKPVNVPPIPPTSNGLSGTDETSGLSTGKIDDVSDENQQIGNNDTYVDPMTAIAIALGREQGENHINTGEKNNIFGNVDPDPETTTTPPDEDIVKKNECYPVEFPFRPMREVGSYARFEIIDSRENMVAGGTPENLQVCLPEGDYGYIFRRDNGDIIEKRKRGFVVP